MLDEIVTDWRSRIARDGGPPRLRSGPLVGEILDDLAATGRVEDVLARRPGLTAEAVRACLFFVAEHRHSFPTGFTAPGGKKGVANW